jgi:hypothetical protein
MTSLLVVRMDVESRPDTEGSVVAFGFWFSTRRPPSHPTARKPKRVRRRRARFIGLGRIDDVVGSEILERACRS